ncbi:MAG TPA: glycosyltransferase [Candidatus Binatia bacterium]|nr:glycosyltransferase [Candidatus Binatia bacterium]
MSVLVVSWDRIGELMAGSAVRALEMARALAARRQDVVLAAPAGSACPPSPGLRLACVPRDAELRELVAAADVVVIPGRMELMTAVKKPLVVDLYDPFILSNLDLFGSGFARSRGRSLLALRWLQHHLKHGDFFLCASPAQRSFWLGMLAAAGRINRANYERDPELRNLIDVVPFGVPDEPPEGGPPVVKGVVPGIGPADRVVLWAGGMWNWVDPLALVRAQALLGARRSDVKTLILGTRHPNPEIGEMEIARRAIALAEELGLRDRGVSFVEWVPYGDRARWLLESDVGVSLHRRGVESEFAFRTRVLDYLWALRPMVVTAGDDLADRIARDDLGRVVPADDPAAVAAAIEQLVDDPGAGARSARLRAARASFAWSEVVAPLARFCAAPERAADQAGDAWFPRPAVRADLPTKEEALIADEYLTAARAISPGLGRDFAPVQRFRAAYDGLCQVDVLMWVEPPVAGWNLRFDLLFAGEDPTPAASVTVPAAALPRCDWQRFEFRPIAESRGRDFEIRLRLVPVHGEARDRPPGRVCVWRSAPPPGEPLGDESLAFIARYLIADVQPEVPTPPDSFLFLHNATLPLPPGADETLPIATADAPEPAAEGEGDATARAPEGPPSGADRGAVDRLAAELARVAAQAALAERRLADLQRDIDARIDAEARAIAREEMRSVPLGAWLVERSLRAVVATARAASKIAVALFVLGLVLACVPLALTLAVGLALVDATSAVRRRRAPEPVAGRGVSAEDAVSVVIPTWNGRELLEMSLPPLLAAVRAHGHPGDEIVVVDNGSDDGSRELLAQLAAEHPALRAIALESNEGFAGAANRGAREARNPVLVLLNNDMVVEPDFVQPLLDAFAAEPGAFGVSCQIDFIDPTKERWETGKVHARLERGGVRLFHLDRFDEDLIYPVFFAGGGASAYDREKFLALGGFDEEVFSPVYIEDVDLGYRAWKRGWPSVLAPRSMVHHKHRGTTRRLWSEGRIHSFFVKNLAALLWKDVSAWRLLARHLAGLPYVPIKVWREQGGRSALATVSGLARQLPRAMRARRREAGCARVLRDEDIFLLSRYRYAYRARFHANTPRADARPQVLVVSPYGPVPAIHGGATRISNLLREMRDDCDVTLVSFYDTAAEARPESLAALRDLCRDAELVPRDEHGRGRPLMPDATVGFWSRRMFDEIEWWLDRRSFDVVQVEYTHMAHYLPPPAPGLRRVLVEHDVAFVAVGRARRSATSLARGLARWIDELRTLRYEVAAVDGADDVVVMSDADRRALARFVANRRLHVVPNGVSCRDFPFRDARPELATILFVGFFRHDPNVEAVLWFAREVLPRVRARIPSASFRVVGAYPPAAVTELAGEIEGLELAGMVPETASHYRRAAVFVAPILRGSGTRLKILEAMASGCPVVSTTIGAEGLGAGDGEIRIADDPASFADAVCALLASPPDADALARRARRFVEQRYDWPAIAARLLAVYGVAPAASRDEADGRAADAADGASAGDAAAGAAALAAADEGEASPTSALRAGADEPR